MYISKVKVENFTAFDKAEIKFSTGLNIFIGENGTGKTHIMKLLYAACDVSKTKLSFADKLIKVFLPTNKAIGRLVKRSKVSSRCTAEITKSDSKLKISFSNHATIIDSATVTGAKAWCKESIQSVYIPVKEMLSNAPGFKSLYSMREIHFEEIYPDIIDRALLPSLKGKENKRTKLLNHLQRVMDGKIYHKNEEFYLKNKRGNLEFTLLAEGMRKLGLLWLLIQNGVLLKGSVLFWDEPETNLNPKLLGDVIEILLELQRMGVQIFLATHNYVILKEFDQRAKKEDKVKYHSFYYSNDKQSIALSAADKSYDLEPNMIGKAFDQIYDNEVKRALDL